jgi:tetratricopeptide (TPR) repeat protein
MQPEQVLDVLAHLVDKSLVQADAQEGETRYRMLETIRQYAREKLAESGESERARGRLLDYWLKLAESIEPKLRTAEQLYWWTLLERELDNVRSALDWSLSGAAVEQGLRLASALNFFWVYRGHHAEGIERLESLLAREPVAARTLAGAKALLTLGAISMRIGDLERAKTAAAEALAIGQQRDDAWTTANAYFNLGWASGLQGQTAEATAFLQRGLGLYRTLGDAGGANQSLIQLGIAALQAGDYTRAQAWLAESAAYEREQGDKSMLSYVLRHWGFALLHQRDPGGAAAKFRESLSLIVERGEQAGTPDNLAAFGAVALGRAQLESAAQLFAAADARLEAVHTPMSPYDRDQYARNLAVLRAQLDDASLKAAWAAGRALSFEQATALAVQVSAIDPLTPTGASG